MATFSTIYLRLFHFLFSGLNLWRWSHSLFDWTALLSDISFDFHLGGKILRCSAAPAEAISSSKNGWQVRLSVCLCGCIRANSIDRLVAEKSSQRADGRYRSVGPGLRGDSWPPPAARCEIIQRPIENRANIAILVFLFYFFSQSNFWCFRWMMKHPDCLDYVVKDQLMYIIPALKLTINCTRCLRPILRQWLFNKRWYEPIFLLCYYPSWWKIHDVIFSLFFLSFYLLAHFILYSCVCGIISRRIELLFVRRVLLGAPFQTALRQRWLRPRACSRKTSSSR